MAADSTVRCAVVDEVMDQLTMARGMRSMVVEEVGDVARVVLPSTAGGKNVDVAGQTAPVEPGGFEPRFHVCINPLCRRKWKQLAAKVLPLFCPPCKRHLEEGIPSWHDLSEPVQLERMYERWHSISEELAEELGCPPPSTPATSSSATPLMMNPSPLGQRSIDESDQAAWMHGAELLQAFQGCLEKTPDVDEVRNWNSVHGRRKHFRGRIFRNGKRFVCTLTATEELDEDLKHVKVLPPDFRDYKILDWNETYADRQEVDFIAFPNPAVSERNKVSRVVRLLTNLKGQDSCQEHGHPLPASSSRPIVKQSGDDAFGNVLAWSDDASADTNPAKAEPSRKRLSLEDALPIGGCSSLMAPPHTLLASPMALPQPALGVFQPIPTNDIGSSRQRKPKNKHGTGYVDWKQPPAASPVVKPTTTLNVAERLTFAAVATPEVGAAGSFVALAPASSSTMPIASPGFDPTVLTTAGGANSLSSGSSISTTVGLAKPGAAHNTVSSAVVGVQCGSVAMPTFKVDAASPALGIPPIATAAPRPPPAPKTNRVKNPKPKPGALQAPLLVQSIGRMPSTPCPRSPYAAYFGD